ncbi:MAG: hypothetical protein GEU99_16225 [Luteitalea sp.]|nr:hypothetical protein [Luteitalea sp.]
MRVKFIGWFVAAGGAIALMLLVTGVLSGPTSAPAAAAPPDGAREAVVSVSGLVCSICANSLEAHLRKMAAVDEVTVDLDKQVATLRVKPDVDVTDLQIKDVVRTAGFRVTNIEWRGEATAASGEKATATFTIDGMDCTRCAANLARLLEEEPGIAAARVDFENKRAVVDYDANTTSPEQIEQTINDLGVLRAEHVSTPATKDKE